MPYRSVVTALSALRLLFKYNQTTLSCNLFAFLYTTYISLSRFYDTASHLPAYSRRDVPTANGGDHERAQMLAVHVIARPWVSWA